MAAVPLFQTFETEVMLAAEALHVKASTIFLDSLAAIRAYSLYFSAILDLFSKREL